MAVTFNYGSNHNKREIEYAKLHCQRLGIKHIIIPLDFMHTYFKSSLLEGADAIPEGHYADSNMKSTVVPFRNGIMLAIACGIAESNKLTRVFFFNDSGYNYIYTDCRQQFIDAMSAAMTNGTYEGVHIFAPYTNISKANIAQRGARIGINYAETYSCYKGGVNHCGKCGTCIERREALAEAGVTDTTTYDE